MEVDSDKFRATEGKWRPAAANRVEGGAGFQVEGGGRRAKEVDSIRCAHRRRRSEQGLTFLLGFFRVFRC